MSNLSIEYFYFLRLTGYNRNVIKHEKRSYKDIKPSSVRDHDSILFLISPSWLSIVVSVVAGLIVSVGVLIVFSFHHSQVQQQLLIFQNTKAQTAVTLPGQASGPKNSLQNTWPLLIFWSLLGLAVYFVIEELIRLLQNFAQLRRELDYMPAQRNKLLKSTLESVAVRLAAVLLWILYAELFFKRIIPYSITAANASAADFFSLAGIASIISSFLLITIGVHIHVIFARITFQRTRLFSRESYI